MAIFTARHHLFCQTFLSRNDAVITPEYDFVVVGGGASGCALATRLSQAATPGFSVLLIEQGTTCGHMDMGLDIQQHPELQNSVALPLQTRTLHGSSFDAAYPTVSKGQFGAHPVILNSGKVLGGSTCINWAIWTRGPKDDYDEWARLVGNTAYAWDAMRATFSEIEASTDAAENAHAAGPIAVRRISASPRKQPGRWSAAAAASFAHAGFERAGGCEDAGAVLGYDEIRESVGVDGRRATADAYLGGARVRGERADGCGLDVWTAVRAERIVFEREGGCGEQRAVGVETDVGIVRARKEVILTAGAIQSAHLLLLSGIGPSSQLLAHGVDVVHANDEVGVNLWEHPVVDVRFKLKDERRGDTAEDLASVKTAGRHLHEWATHGTGLMSGCPYEWMGFSNIKSHIEDIIASEGIPTLSPRVHALLMRPTVPHIEHFLHYGHGLAPAPDPLASSYIAVSTVLLTPVSRGTVRLQSGGGVAAITLNQLRDPLDREMMLRALQTSFAILNSPAWSAYLEQRDAPTREELLDLMHERVTTLWHVGGSCSTRTVHSPGVVDSSLRVIGVAGLRVADTSVIPFPLAAHTQAVAYALGETAAKFIKEEYTDVTN